MSDNVPVLSLQQLSELLLVLNDIADKWFSFGVHLGLPTNELEKIEASHRGELDRCKIAMLQYWLTNSANPTWKDVVQALEKIGQAVLALRVQEKYLLPTGSGKDSLTTPTTELPACTTLSAQSSTTPLSQSSAHSTTDEEIIKVEIKADAGVVEELQQLENFFYRTLVRVKKWLKANCDLPDARQFLNGVTGTREFSSCDNFDQLMEELQQDHVDVFNISKLHGLASCFDENMAAKNKITELIESYEKKRQSFLEQKTVLGFQQAVASRVKPVPEGKAVVTIKVPQNMATLRTLKDIEELAKKGFEENYESFTRLHAEPGSVIISWVFPEALSDKLEQLACANAAIFKKEGVEEVTVGGRRVYPVTQQKDIPTSLQDDSKEEKIEQKQDYTEVCHQLVDSVSNLHDCQSHTKVHSTLISQEKLAQPSLSQTIIVSEYSKVLGVEEPHLQTVLTKVAGVQARVQTELMMTPQLQQGITPTYQQLLEELKDIDDWYLFGVFLGMTAKQLNKIKASYGHDLERCKMEMFRCWLENKAGASWNDVVESLEKADKEGLAAKVKQKFLMLVTDDDADAPILTDLEQESDQSVPRFSAPRPYSVDGAVTNPKTPLQRVVPFQFTFYKYDSRSKFVSQVKNSQKPYLVIDECLKSHPFYTHKYGYKMCIGVAPQGVYEGKGSHLSLYAYLMKGDYDNNLPWPFRGTVHLELINQLNPNEGHYQVKPIKFDNTIPSIACARVTMGDYSPHGWAKCQSISNNMLKNKDQDNNTQYLKDDTIIIRVVAVKMASEITYTPCQPAPLASTMSTIHTAQKKRVAPYEFTLNYTAKCEYGELWQSKSFYSHDKGYLMCVEVMPPRDANRDHLSVYIRLKKGDYDDNLTWPFQGKVTIQLVNQEANERHREVLIYFTDLVPAMYCERVTEGSALPSHGWGTDYFISKSALERDEEHSEKFLKDGILKFRVINVTLIETR